MQIAANQLARHLQGGVRPLYVLHGDEALLQQEAADAIRQAARAQGYTERTVHTVAGAHFDWSPVLAAGGSLSLFADKQIVEIRIPSGKPGKDGSVALQQVAQDAVGNDSTLTVVVLPRLDKATKSTAWFVALEQNGASIQLDTLERAALPNWIAQRLGAQGQRVEAGEAGQHTLQFFADRVEGNLLAAHQEIQKLALLYPPDQHPVLTYEQVEQAVLNVARYDVFKLSDAVLAGQLARVQRMLDGLQAEGEAEVLVHYTLAEDIRALQRVKLALQSGKPMPMALRENRIWGNKERLFERLLPRLEASQVSQWLQAAHAVDGIVKGLKRPDWPLDGWQALHQLAQQVCQACAQALQGKAQRS
ncbi:DNA polymerase III subunit delta [Curvibacter sp. CHRR-16]|uniref:DNA polymerase III subunit delta n=1 Tax=Curvibacter sp. CHRR-16 TaxID=2835872 RepID=UPI001BD9E514|nr:DNA polymerase III subunit delta [Curvibacter sp. CHRR-16]MBT0570467.1 DNA polymerase III subunit delta [Curvibacter sp. CHRR-16]